MYPLWIRGETTVFRIVIANIYWMLALNQALFQMLYMLIYLILISFQWDRTIMIPIQRWGNAGDTGSSPGLGRAHRPRSGWAHEPHLLSLRVWSLCSATREAAIVRGPRTAMKSGPRFPQLEKAHAQKRRPNTAKNKNKLILKNCFHMLMES